MVGEMAVSVEWSERIARSTRSSVTIVMLQKQ